MIAEWKHSRHALVKGCESLGGRPCAGLAAQTLLCALARGYTAQTPFLGPARPPPLQDPPYGADVLRLWVASVDYSSDVLIGGRILSQVGVPGNACSACLYIANGSAPASLLAHRCCPPSPASHPFTLLAVLLLLLLLLLPTRSAAGSPPPLSCCSPSPNPLALLLLYRRWPTCTARCASRCATC